MLPRSKTFDVLHCFKSVVLSNNKSKSGNVIISVATFSTQTTNNHVEVPKKFNFCSDVIDKWAEQERNGYRHSSNPAFWWIDDYGNQLHWNFQDISHESKRIANILTNQIGLKRGDKLKVILPRVPEWWLINLACIRAGIIVSAGTTLLRSSDIQHRLLASQAKCVITDASMADYVDQVAENCPELKEKICVENIANERHNWKNFNKLLDNVDYHFEDEDTYSNEPMMLFFTSGTTGSPKMTEHTHASYGIGHRLTAEYFLRINSEDLLWNMSDTGWAKSAWSNLFAPWIKGAGVFIHHTPKFEPKVMLKNLCKYPITHLCAPPTAFRSVVKLPLKDYKFHSLKYCFGAGEPVNPELITEWTQGTNLRLYEGYGQTETTFLCGTNYPEMEYRSGSMGKPPPGVDLQIVNENGVIMEPEQEGNIAVRCKPNRPVGLFTRYIDDEERTKSVLSGDFYLTGDKGKMDKDGYFYFIGRSDDVILSAGYRIGPFEVESALLEHPAVLESAVVSSPDESRGEVVKAFVVLTDLYKNKVFDTDDLIKEIQDHVKNTAAPYKYPRKIEFVSDLPKTVSGKIRRIELRNKEWNRKE